MPLAIVGADAQTSAPAQSSGGGTQAGSGGTQAGGSETRSMDGTTTQGPAANGGMGAGAGTFMGLGTPTIRLSGFRFTASADIAETYTTNSLGVPTSVATGYSSSDFITTATLSMALHDHTPRLDADLAYSLSGYHFASNPDFDRLSHFMTALMRADLIRNRLLLTGSAFAAPILINGLGPQSASATNSGLRDTYGFTISPTLLFRFGQFARSQTTLTQSSVFFVQPNGPTIDQTIPGAVPVPNEVISYGVGETISSGADFFRLNWAVSGTYNKTQQAGVDFDVASSVATVRYAFSHAIIATTAVGYQSLSSNLPLSQSLNAPTASVGLQYRPNNDFQANATVGWLFNSLSYNGDFRYQLGGSTSLVGAFTDNVTTPGGRLIGNLANLGVNGTGDFINTTLQVNPLAPVGGIGGFNPIPLDGTAITSGIVRYRYGTISLVHVSGRTQYRWTAFHTDYETLTELSPGNSPQGTSTGVDVTISRNITPRLTGSVQGDVSNVRDLGGKYQFYQGGLSLNYAMTPLMGVYFQASYAHRSSAAALAASSSLSGSYSDERITIGLHRQFY